MSGVRRIVRPAISAMDHDAMNSVLLGVQQDRPALAACEIHGLVYLLEYWRGV
jgi:hypothetical protein